MYVPELKINVLSISALTQRNGVRAIFDKSVCEILIDGSPCLRGERQSNGLYLLKNVLGPSKVLEVYSAKVVIKPDSFWHQRLCHLNEQAVHETLKKSDISYHKQSGICESCSLSKSTKVSVPKESSRKHTAPLSMVHSDVCGPFRTPTRKGEKYFVTFIDDYSRYSVVYLLKEKSEVLNVFKDYLTMFERQTEKKLKSLRSDGGGEYGGTVSENNKFDIFCKEKGIRHERTVPYKPSQNGLAERKNRTLVEAVRCMLSHSNLSKKYWGDAILAANFARNMCVSAATGQVPYERFFNQPTQLERLRVWGCVCYTVIPFERRSNKLDQVSRKCVFSWI